MGFPRIPFLPPFAGPLFLLKWVFKVIPFENQVYTSFQGYYLPLLRFGIIFWFLEFPSLTFRLRMETPKTRFWDENSPIFLLKKGPQKKGVKKGILGNPI